MEPARANTRFAPTVMPNKGEHEVRPYGDAGEGEHEVRPYGDADESEHEVRPYGK
jgi:hypothetical protein